MLFESFFQAFFQDKSKHRSVHLGPYPLEALARDPEQAQLESRRTLLRQAPLSDIGNDLGQVAARYTALFMAGRNGLVAAEAAPVPADLERRAVDIKGLAYFFDADHVGICALPASARLVESEALSHPVAVVVVVRYGRLPESGNAARDWVGAAAHEIAELRAAEIAVVLAGYVRQLGFSAMAHVASATAVDLQRLAVLGGVAVRQGEGVVSPYLDDQIALAAVTTDYDLAKDMPLAPLQRKVKGRKYHRGLNGAVSGKEWARREKRPSHLSRYPMEGVKRVARPTTLVLDDEIPRVPKRANFFVRARFGDLGEKARREVQRFAFKHPSTAGAMELIRGIAGRQDGEVAAGAQGDDFADPASNAAALKSLGYHLGADLIGVCEIPEYAWYSHDLDGVAIEPYHRYALVMLIDQGFDTMEGASGDDWVSGPQSVRGYLRGAEIAGVMAEFLRGRGISARAQTNSDSDVLHIPLLLWAGLGELSRIGELVLNPFVGPRFKSVVLTTNLPLAVDKPIDFGLQYFCRHCLKCARECPVDAIPFGDKVMFNGYEMWKPDVERCTQYRITNQKGAACGRCMKTCPLNKVVSADAALVPRLGTWLGIHARWLKLLLVPVATRLDDRLGFGRRNPVKKWWLDLEVVDGVCVAAQANQRELNLQRNIDTSKPTVGYYPANVMPPAAASESVPVNRRRAKDAGEELETPGQAVARRRAGGAPPAHYIPVVSIHGDPD